MTTNNLNENRQITDNNITRDAVEKIRRIRAEERSFVRAVVFMFIIFAGILLSIFILADNESFLSSHFGGDAPITRVFLKLSKTGSSKERANFFPFGLKRQNILLLGVDSNNDTDADIWKGTRTDTIIVVNIEPHTKSINALSIPRDSKVYLPHNAGVNKINAAHAIGGIKMVIETVENTLGIHIDRYIMIHDDAVKEIVNAMGGIDIYVEKPMHYNDYTDNLHINLTKGNHRLTGEEAAGYLRFRHDALGDIGRTQRQQWFIRSLIKELQTPKAITKIPEIITTSVKYIKTDMSVYEMSQYAALARQIDINNTVTAMLPGAPNQKGYISYWILDPEKTQEVVNRLIHREKSPLDETYHYSASIMHSSDRAEDARQLVNAFKNLDIEVNCTGESNQSHSQFIAHSNKITNEYYNRLNRKVSGLNGIQFVYAPDNYYCGETDFTIILSHQ